jgi:hypothetical protein
MPIPEDYRDICEMLLDATRRNRVKWIEKGGSIAVQFAGLNLEIWSGNDELSERAFVAVGLKDSKSNLIDNWYVEEGDDGFAELHELWSSARRRARDVPKKLEALRKLLRSGGEIGEE